MKRIPNHPRVDDSIRSETCRRYIAGESVSTIAPDLGIDDSTAFNILRRTGVPRNKHYSTTPSQQSEICTRYTDGETVQSLAHTFGRSKRAIRKMLSQDNVERRTWSVAHRRYHCNDNFFDNVHSERAAYWLGFIAADGCVKGNAIEVQLSSKDQDHLQQLKFDWNAESPIHFDERGKCSLRVTSEHCVHALQKHGIVPSKTLILKWPGHLSLDSLKHYLRGYSDGDGYFGTYNAQHVSTTQLRWTIVGTQDTCEGARGVLMRHAQVGRVKLNPTTNGRVFYLSYGGTRQVPRIWHLLYDNATVWMPRKRAVIEPYL